MWKPLLLVCISLHKGKLPLRARLGPEPADLHSEVRTSAVLLRWCVSCHSDNRSRVILCGALPGFGCNVRSVPHIVARQSVPKESRPPHHARSLIARLSLAFQVAAYRLMSCHLCIVQRTVGLFWGYVAPMSTESSRPQPSHLQFCSSSIAQRCTCFQWLGSFNRLQLLPLAHILGPVHLASRSLLCNIAGVCGRAGGD